MKVSVGLYLINFLGRGIQTITLNNPITIDSTSISELTLRRPKVRDYLAIDRLDGSNLAREVALTANLASVTKETIEELDIVDYVKIQEVLRGFFPSQRT